MENKRLSKKDEVPFIILEKDDLFRSYGECNLALVKPVTDLSKINLKTNFKKKYENYPTKYKIDVFYEDTKLKAKAEIGAGSYGKVILYEGVHKNQLRSVVVKIPIGDADPYEEPDILKAYMKKAFICNHYVIPIRSVNDQHGNPFIIMQQANGSVDKLEMDNRLKIKFIIYITRIIKCFYNHGFVYPDLKLENMLYKCNGEKIEFFLGDIGSFAPINSDGKKDNINVSFSFVPPEYAYGDKKYRKADKQSALYTLGATIADVYKLADDIYYADSKGNDYTSQQLKKEQIPNFHKKIKNSNIPDAVKDIILAFTTISPKKRLEYNFDIVFDKLCPRKK